jgi:hypothetical protein
LRERLAAEAPPCTARTRRREAGGDRPRGPHRAGPSARRGPPVGAAGVGRRRVQRVWVVSESRLRCRAPREPVASAARDGGHLRPRRRRVRTLGHPEPRRPRQQHPHNDGFVVRLTTQALNAHQASVP